MQFFHFKEIPPASFPNNETQTLSHCPRANNNPSLALPSLDQTQLLQSARSSSSSQPDSEALPAPANWKVLRQVLPRFAVMDSNVKQ